MNEASADRRSTVLQATNQPLTSGTGRPIPLGVSEQAGRKNFAIFADDCVSLVVFMPDSQQTRFEVELYRTGHVWHVELAGLPDEFEYAFRRNNIDELLLDPYCRSVAGAEVWGALPQKQAWAAPWDRVRKRRSRFRNYEFDWEDDQPVRIPMSDTIIYELHVRGFTRNTNSRVTHPGTYLGLIEKIPHLLQLGVTTVELLPVMEWEENDNPRRNPITKQPLSNYWGYHPLAYFAPKAAFASEPSNEVNEFREMVKAFHVAGIEVLLDVVYNHTGESDADCPTFSFRGLADSVYYAMEPSQGAYRNDTGCGNTLSTNHPVVQNLVIDSLRYWVTEMHVDGFRFDLASIFSRGASGEVLHRSPIIDRITHDPVLAHVKLIAEPWDAAGLYQVGEFANGGRWAEWNDHFRDNVRRFIKSDSGMASALAAALVGSPAVYSQTHASINFVSCHDGFTMADVVAYNEKRNLTNGEGCRDGSNDNHSWNSGVEGSTDDEDVLQLRSQQLKNMATLLFMSQGVPMFHAGDEFGRTQHGNNNGYCQDSELNWIDWSLAETNSELLRFFQKMIRFRTEHLPRWYDRHHVDHHVRWHGREPYAPEFDKESRSLAMQVLSSGQGREVLLITNAFWEEVHFRLPQPESAGSWRIVIDTSAPSPLDIVDPASASDVVADSVNAKPRSVLVLCAW